MKNNWILKETTNINDICKVRTNIENRASKNMYCKLLTIKHHYLSSDDIQFPEASTLAFLSAFEEESLFELDKNDDIIYINSTISNGIIELNMYVKDADKSIYDCISYLKQNPLFKVEFVITYDKDWDFYKKLISC